MAKIPSLKTIFETVRDASGKPLARVELGKIHLKPNIKGQINAMQK